MAKGKRNNTLIISLVTVVILLVVLVIIQNGKGSKGERVTTEEVMARPSKKRYLPVVKSFHKRKSKSAPTCRAKSSNYTSKKATPSPLVNC